MIQQTEPTPEALQAAQRIVEIVNLDGTHKLNGKATQDIAAIIEREAIPPVQMTDAPFSWTVTAADESGFSELWTVRAASSKGFIARVDALKKHLIERGYTPAARNGNGHAAPASENGETAPMCGIHHTPMKKRDSNKGGFFWSCPQKLDTGEWCPYKPPKT